MPYLGVRPADITSATEAEIAGDLTVDTNTLKVDAANNRVGVGTTAGDAGASLTVNKSPVAAHGNPLLQVGGATFTSGGYYTIGLGYTNSTYTEPPAEISYISQSDSGGTKGAIVFGTRDVTTNTAVTERLRILSGGGLTFNGDTAAANALDDYEEGTWTVNIKKGGSALAVGSRNANYIRVGKLLWISFYWFNTSISTSGSSDYTVEGFPYNIDLGQGSGYQFVPAGYFNIGSTNAFNSEPHRWQANATDKLTMYGASSTDNVSSALLQLHGAGVLQIA